VPGGTDQRVVDVADDFERHARRSARVRERPGSQKRVPFRGDVLQHGRAVDALEVVVGEAEEGVVVAAVVEEGLEAGELEAAGRLMMKKEFFFFFLE